MYILIIIIHAVFTLISYLLEYRILAGIFIILCIFFLFYFSPLFFLDPKEEQRLWEERVGFRERIIQFSPKDSILLPVVLLYIALYGFIISIFGGTYDFITLHSGMVGFIFFIFIGYALSFYWKHDVFFHLFRFHTIFTLISSIIFALIYSFWGERFTLFYPFIGIIGVIGWIFLLSYSKKENILFLVSFLTGIYASLYSLLPIFSEYNTLLFLLFCGSILACILFEFIPKMKIFAPYIEFFQYYNLFALLFFIPFILFFAFTTIEAMSIFILIGILLFFLSIHIRYTNYIVFLVSILIMYAVYGLIFIDLIQQPSMSSVFLFIFFLPILLIGTTYFYEEQHQYDFMILHYSSVAFSIIFSLYIVFFIWWGWDLLFVTSLSIFGTAFLLFMSYFRFRNSNISLTH